NLKKTLFASLSVSSQGGLIIGIGTNLSNLSVRYANLFSFANAAGNLGGTHEFAVGGGFKKQKTIIIIPPDPVIDSTLLVNNSKQNKDTIQNNVAIISIIKTDTIIKTDKTRILKGILTDQTTGKPIGGLVEVFDNSSNTVIATTNSDSISGKYEVQVPLNKNLGLAVKVKDKMFHSENFTFAETDTTDFEMPTIALQPLQPGTKIILNNIFFQSGSDTPTAESYAEFDRLIQLLNEHSNLRIKITGHTDNTGTLELNQTISTNRAREVVNYLVSKGIAKSRLDFEGFADTQPIADNTTEEGKDKNRRVEAEIVK
ncbi:MAG TPA: hypothetical protein DCQ31_18940, partial [Bacteroidales bacterium]|nr:hypothetical protein [Bacteroidales bacterium]